jgi:HSP20 family protein
MLVRYWQPWREIETLSRQLDRVFDDFASTATGQAAWSPPVELRDAGEHFVLRVQLPGIDANDVDIQATKQAVVISGEFRNEHKAEEQGYVRSEFRYGTFRRIIPLPVGIQNEQVYADYKDGVLSLTLPKVAKARNTVVKINLGSLNQTESAPAEAPETASETAPEVAPETASKSEPRQN